MRIQVASLPFRTDLPTYGNPPLEPGDIVSRGQPVEITNQFEVALFLLDFEALGKIPSNQWAQESCLKILTVLISTRFYAYREDVVWGITRGGKAPEYYRLPYSYPHDFATLAEVAKKAGTLEPIQQAFHAILEAQPPTKSVKPHAGHSCLKVVLLAYGTLAPHQKGAFSVQLGNETNLPEIEALADHLGVNPKTEADHAASNGEHAISPEAIARIWLTDVAFGSIKPPCLRTLQQTCHLDQKQLREELERVIYHRLSHEIQHGADKFANRLFAIFRYAPYTYGAFESALNKLILHTQDWIGGYKLQDVDAVIFTAPFVPYLDPALLSSAYHEIRNRLMAVDEGMASLITGETASYQADRKTREAIGRQLALEYLKGYSTTRQTGRAAKLYKDTPTQS